jgi:AmmeMemoRadiSam system protein A
MATPVLQPGHPARLELTDAAVVVRAACALVAAAARQQPVPPVDLGADGVRIVSGVFVSLHDPSGLLGCVGYLGTPMPLGPTLVEAARLATVDDPRFPPVTAVELPEIEVEAWLLFGLSRMPDDPALRRSLITVGRHGLELSWGGARGVFLPSVPIEQGWDVDRYLEHLGAKAGLPGDAWRQPGSRLDCFEGLCLRGRIEES